LDFVREHKDADLILVAMATPRSEEFMIRAAPLLPGKVLWNIGGGTLNFYAGTLPRVPTIVSKLCLQWLWRILCEPKIASRYFIGIPQFIRSVFRLRRQQTHAKGVCLCSLF
jgi:exopolysaccharide biosynthesis WecB/TagA/CpsF family protein